MIPTYRLQPTTGFLAWAHDSADCASPAGDGRSPISIRLVRLSRAKLRSAVRRVGAAVDLVRDATGSPAADAALVQARAALDKLTPSPSAQALGRLLDSAADCQRARQSSSPELEANFRAASTLLAGFR